jgi:DNA-binding MarR family transcriptional regulator
MKNSFAAEATKRTEMVDLDQHVPALCNTIGGYISRIVLASCAAEHGIGILEWRIVLVLGGDAPLEISQVADRVAMDRGGCSRSIAALEERGLIVRVSNAADRRRSPVQLTAAGRKLCASLSEFARASSEELLSVLTQDERKTVLDCLNRLRIKAIDMHAQEWRP